MARLVLLQGGEAVPYELLSASVVLGRHPDCDIQLQSNMVSRRHAEVTVKNGQYLLADLGSGNGTYLNGNRVEKSVILKHEDRVKVGPVLLRFENEHAAAGSFGQTVLGGINFSSDDSQSTIMGTTSGLDGYGMLNVRPEEKLKAVLEISRSLAGTIELDALLPKVLDTLFGIFPQADRGCIMLKDTETGEMIPKAIKHRRSDEDASVKLSRTIVNKVLSDKAGILSADAANDSQFDASESISTLSIRSMMCVPMLSLENEPIGIINIDTQNPVNQFQTQDLELLLAVASQAALSYEGARLLTSYLEKQKQDRELEIARDVQRALLPEELPQVSGYEFYASYDSAQAVGGDYYDAMMLDDDRICLSFGDVAGKGVPGALIMSRMSSCVQNTMAFTGNVAEAVEAINNHMCANAVEGRFVTYLLAVIDLKTHEMTLVNAGHMSPIIRLPNGEIEEFEEETIGLPIGVMEDYPFDVVQRVIGPGETVVFFTDGVDEAMNPAGELYSMERLRQFIVGNTYPATELGKQLLADVRKHADGRPQNDDITIMTFGRNAN